MIKKIKLKTIVSYIFALFITISIAVLSLTIMLSRGLVNKDTFLSGFSNSSFYEEKIGLLQNNLSDRLQTAGLPEECGDNVIVSGAVTVEINNAIKNIINNEEVRIDYEKPGSALRTNITDYLKSNGIDDDGEIKDAINLIVTETEKDYKTQLSFGFVKKFYDFFEKYDMIIYNVKILSIIVLILSCLALLFIKGRKYRAIRLIECGMFAGSILAFLVTIFMKHDIVKYIPENSGVYRDFIISFIRNSFYQGNYIFAIGLLLVVLLNIINRYFKKQVI